MMFADTNMVDCTKSTSVPADMTDDSCIFDYPYIEIAPLTRDTDGTSTTECDSGDCYTHVKRENLPEPHHVCCTVFLCKSRS